MRGRLQIGSVAFLLAVVSASVPALTQASCEKGYVVTFRVKEGAEAAFENVLLGLVAKVRGGEKGNLFYQPYRGPGVSEYVMVERYADAAARDAHGDSAAVKEAFPKLLPFLREPPTVLAISALECAPK